MERIPVKYIAWELRLHDDDCRFSYATLYATNDLAREALSRYYEHARLSGLKIFRRPCTPITAFVSPDLFERVQQEEKGLGVNRKELADYHRNGDLVMEMTNATTWVPKTYIEEPSGIQ